MCDEYEVLVDSPGRTPPDIEGALELGYNDTGLVTPDGQALDREPLDVDRLAKDLGTGLAVLLLLLNRMVDGS